MLFSVCSTSTSSSPRFPPSPSRIPRSRSFSLANVMNLAFASFALVVLIPVANFPCRFPFFFSPHERRRRLPSRSYSSSFLPPLAFSSPYFLPLFLPLSLSTSRSRVKPSATTDPADEKGISSLSFSPFPSPGPRLTAPSYSNFLSPLYGAIVRGSAKEERRGATAPAGEPGRAPFLIFPGTIVSA